MENFYFLYNSANALGQQNNPKLPFGVIRLKRLIVASERKEVRIMKKRLTCSKIFRIVIKFIVAVGAALVSNNVF